MGKTVEDICKLMSKTVCFDSDSLRSAAKMHKTLSSATDYNIVQSGKNYLPLYEDDELYNKLQRAITKELASALDRNSVKDIKYLKEKYGHLEEFSVAKSFLNRKCKEIWNVYKPLNKIPKEAMKALGITNIPTLDVLLDTAIKFENDKSEILPSVIDSVLKNVNMDYRIEDIHKYLRQMYIKRKYKCNSKTAQYLIKEHNYTQEQLCDLGAGKVVIKAAISELNLKCKIRYFAALVNSKLKSLKIPVYKFRTA